MMNDHDWYALDYLDEKNPPETPPLTDDPDEIITLAEKWRHELCTMEAPR